MKKLTCHCGGIEIEISLPDGMKKLARCNCSICKRRSAVMVMVNSNDLQIVKGKQLIKLYQFHTKVAKHYFCSVCGIYTHHTTRRDPTVSGFNAGCLEGVNPYDPKDVSLVDGANHPLDKK